MSQYEKLNSFLSKQTILTQRMTFGEVEKILGFSLPPSAYKYQAWWANNPIPSRHSYVWISIGWKTEELDLDGQKVTFRRTGNSQPAKPKQTHTKTAHPSEAQETTHSTNTFPLADTLPVQVSVDVKWRNLGTLTQDEDFNLSFPSAPAIPGLYRFRLVDSNSRKNYIGETIHLRRRFQHYRTPGPSQATNIRINDLLKAHLDSGGNAEVDIIIDSVILTVSGKEISADLNDKATRRLIENAVLVAESGTEIDTLNR